MNNQVDIQKYNPDAGKAREETMQKNTGGPAFPVSFVNNSGFGGGGGSSLCSNGMTLRDYFAAKCMAAVIGTLNGPVVREVCPGDFYYYSECAYKMADAMLRAREET